MGTTLLESHHPESLKIIQILPHLHSGRFLCRCSLRPFFADLFSLPYLLDSLFTGTTREFGKNLCQSKAFEGKDLASDPSQGTIDQGTVMVEDVHDDG